MEEIRSLEDLLDLQVVDLEIDRLLNRRSSLPELDKYRAAHETRTAIEARLAANGAELRDTSLQLDKAEGELVLLEEKKDVEERRLYAGGISARETDHLRQEVEMLKQQSSVAEDGILELMERKERQQAVVASLEDDRREAQAAEDDLEGQVRRLWAEIDAELARKEARKAEIVPLVPDELLELYDEVRTNRDDGVAVGRFAEGVCGGCHLRLSAAEAHEVLKHYPPRCLHCNRILVPQPQ